MDQTPPPPHPLRVLIVEDYEDARESLCLVIGLWGFDCKTAADGPGALQAAADFLPDVVLMDIGLPEMDGYEVARAVRKLPGLSRTLFIAVTGYGHLSRQGRPDGDDFLTYLLKPADLDQLRKLLNLCSLRRGTPLTGARSAADMPPSSSPA
jgi:two-component system CheB/CheR fusion protein